jgi:MoaA/NifB/PqqE/SkfB family radical SAM enzyme
MPHIGMAIQNDSDFCCCNINRESWKNDKHEVLFVHKHKLEDSFKSYTRKIIAASLDRGIQHPSCTFCWDLEKSNQVSPRINFNTAFANIEPVSNQPRVLIIKPGNTCNFACRMCNPATSTSWYADAYELTDKKITFGEYTKQFETIRNSFDKDKELWSQLESWLPSITYIDIYGGEPFLNPAMFNLLDKAIELNLNKNITINIHTNCSIYNKKYLDILLQFQKVNFNVSFDSQIHNQLSYIRHKIDPTVAFDNAIKFIKHFKSLDHVTLSCTCTITTYNVFYIDEIVKNLKDILQIPIFENIVTTDEYDIRHLPAPVKETLLHRLQSEKVKNFITQTIPGCDIYWPKFCQITDKLDKIRQQSFAENFPDWYNILQPYWVK